MTGLMFSPEYNQKVLAVSDVIYELEMLAHCFEIEVAFRSYLSPFVSQSLKNLSLEGLLTHARVLCEFFEMTPEIRKKDTALAADYDFSPRPIEMPDAYKTRLHKDLAHLTYSRIARDSIEQKNWDLQEFRPLLLRCLEFANFLNKSEIIRAVSDDLQCRCQALERGLVQMTAEI